jgi:hypothetical protein
LFGPFSNAYSHFVPSPTNLQPCFYANIPLNYQGAKITIEGVNKKPYGNGEVFIFVKKRWQEFFCNTHPSIWTLFVVCAKISSSLSNKCFSCGEQSLYFQLLSSLLYSLRCVLHV